MPPPREPALQALPLTAVPGDPRRLALLAAVVQDGRERPGQVRSLMQSDCGLCRAYWQEIHRLRPLNWQGLTEVLTAQPRAEFRRWVSAQQQLLAEPAADLAARHERERQHALRRALCGLQVFQATWAEFDPAPATDMGVPGVRTPYERYLLMLRERMFLANLGVLPVSEWFRLPVEALAGLEADKLQAALEARWAAAAAHFPGLTAEPSAWVAAQAAAGDLFPPLAQLEADRVELLRTAGLTHLPAHALVGAR